MVHLGSASAHLDLRIIHQDLISAQPPVTVNLVKKIKESLTNCHLGPIKMSLQDTVQGSSNSYDSTRSLLQANLHDIESATDTVSVMSISPIILQFCSGQDGVPDTSQSLHGAGGYTSLTQSINTPILRRKRMMQLCTNFNYNHSISTDF